MVRYDDATGIMPRAFWEEEWQAEWEWVECPRVETFAQNCYLGLNAPKTGRLNVFFLWSSFKTFGPQRTLLCPLHSSKWTVWLDITFSPPPVCWPLFAFSPGRSFPLFFGFHANFPNPCFNFQLSALDRLTAIVDNSWQQWQLLCQNSVFSEMAADSEAAQISLPTIFATMQFPIRTPNSKSTNISENI